MLHTINKSPFASSMLDTCLRFVADNDPIILFEDGVYAAQAGTAIASKMTDVLKKNKIYVLQADLKARGIDKLITGVQTVDYGGFVDLVAEHKVNSWL